MSVSTSLLIDKPYSDEEFIELMRGLIAESISTNAFYEEAVKRKGFQVEDLNTIEDLELIPYIPTPFFKESANFYKNLLKIPVESPQFLYWNVSSCTSGDPSLVGISVEDREILEQLAKKCLFEFIPRSEADWANTFSLIFSPSLKFLNRIAQRYTKIRPAKLYSSNLSEISIKLTKVKFLIKFFILKALWAILIKRSIRGAFGIDSKFVFKTLDENMEKPEEERKYISLGGSAQLVSKFMDIMKERDISYNLGNNCDVITGGVVGMGIKHN